MNEYEVWMEGYRVTGESAPHRFIGKAEAETFKDACYIAVKNWCSSEEDFKKYYNAGKQTSKTAMIKDARLYCKQWRLSETIKEVVEISEKEYNSKLRK